MTVMQVVSVPGGIKISCLMPCDVRLWPPAGSVRSVLVSLEVLRRMLKGSGKPKPQMGGVSLREGLREEEEV